MNLIPLILVPPDTNSPMWFKIIYLSLILILFIGIIIRCIKDRE